MDVSGLIIQPQLSTYYLVKSSLDIGDRIRVTAQRQAEKMYIKPHTYKTMGHKRFRYIRRAPRLQNLRGVEYTFCIPMVTIELAQTHSFLKVKGGIIDNCARTIALNPHSLGTVSSLITPHLTFHHWSLYIACFTKLYLMFVMCLINCKTE